MKQKNKTLYLASALAFLLIFSLVLFALKKLQARDRVPKLPVEPDEPTPTTASQVCEIENCHGLDIECGSNPPDFCTMEYQLGDFCRQFAKCEIVDGKCQFVSSPDFEQCKTCVEQCDDLECESQCREMFENLSTPEKP